MKEKNVAGLLGIFVGGLGVHKFYLGKYGLGAIYLFASYLLFPYFAFIPALIGMAEGIMFLTMSKDDFDYKYNYDLMAEEKKARYHQGIKETVERQAFQKVLTTKPVHMAWEQGPHIEMDDEERREKIKSKYPFALQDKLLDREAWVGMSEEMVLDTFGSPIKESTDIDGTQQLFYDYYEDPNGEAQYALELIVTNGRVKTINSN